jgi:4-hydroxybenzoate polyprenyltransferase
MSKGLPLIWREMRPHQWIKNLLVFVPLITSHQLSHWDLVLKAAAAFVAFCFVASSVYVLNDLLDLQSDRAHPSKCKRPFASGDLALWWAAVLVPGLLLAGFGITAWLAPSALAVLAGYFALTLLYSYWLKRKLLLDVFALAALYTCRMLLGSAAYHVELSVWLLSSSMFLFLSLGFAKRSAELQNIAGELPNSRRAYAPADLPQVNIFGVAAGFASSLVLTLYMNSDNMRALYRNPNLLWLLFPLMLYWVSRVWILTSRGQMDEDPVLFAVKDRTTILVGVAALTILWMATRDF